MLAPDLIKLIKWRPSFDENALQKLPEDQLEDQLEDRPFAGDLFPLISPLDLGRPNRF